MADLKSITFRKYRKVTLNLIESIKLCKFIIRKSEYFYEIDVTETEETVFTLLDLISNGSKVKQYM